jgi:type II secretory pathway pseudopilin PulG
MTMVELLMATAIMGILAGAMAGIAMAVQQSAVYNYGRTTSAQNARVSLDRINRMILTATSAPNYPGVAVCTTSIGSYLFPDTLLVWHPASGTPANAAGPPLISELVIYCFDPSTPNNLIELTAPTNTGTIVMDSAALSTGSWPNTIAGLKTASSSQKTVLTSLLRTAAAASGSNGLRGVVRFNLDLHATASEWTAYQNGTLPWANIAWPQGLYSTAGALRQALIRTELQLMPAQLQGQQDPSGQQPLVYFGSAALYYQVNP